MKNGIGIIVSYGFIIVIMLLAKWMEKAGRETTRKFIHIMLCNWWFIAMYFFDNLWWAAFVPATFVIINYISYQKDFIKVMERKEKTEGLGTVYYAISLLILAILTFGIHRPEIGLIGVLVMGYGDGLAAVIGKRVKSKEYHILGSKKTVMGSLTMLFVSFILISLYYVIFTSAEIWYLKALMISIIVTVVEAVGIKGTDNLTVPLVTSLLIFYI